MKTPVTRIATRLDKVTRHITEMIALLCTAALLTISTSWAADCPIPQEGDLSLRDFQFKSGEVLPELRLHYRTFGAPVRDQTGTVRNAVLLVHGTTGSGRFFLGSRFCEALYGPGQPLDASRYFIILPDNIGHGTSSKPSDGLHGRFPRYNYEDMVVAQYRLLTEQLGISHLRLVMGTSMGGSLTWLWGTKYPAFMDALVPVASLPVEIGGQNRMYRRVVIDAVRNDPAWKNGEYTSPPPGLVPALEVFFFMIRSRAQLQKQAPSTAAADQLLDKSVQEMLAQTDANDFLYQWEAMRDYNPEPDLEKIQARLVAINFADDQSNPAELGILESAVKRIARGQAVLVPMSDKTRGHVTLAFPDVWQQHVAEAMAESKP